ncbi:MAG TPA: hypothetical protein VLC46_22205 [Thermoanaerobaculia bacterium]|jgi:hypothetical protein|nr:hypothetical protein [Thermoanaerobaculia bacterium]
MHDTRRITLVSRRADQPSRDWNLHPRAANHIIFAGTFSVLSFAVDHVSQDVDRILIDRTATPEEFLDLLTTLPSAFLGDVLLMRDHDGSFLSTAGRAGGRLLYALTPADLQFYLDTLGLVTTEAVAA